VSDALDRAMDREISDGVMKPIFRDERGVARFRPRVVADCTINTRLAFPAVFKPSDVVARRLCQTTRLFRSPSDRRVRNTVVFTCI
jgi:hypothetical protein